MINAVKDVSTLSTIPEKDVIKFLKKFIYSICCGVEESTIKGEDTTTIDLGIGILTIHHDTDLDFEYTFEPCKYLDKNVKATVKSNKNPLEEDLNTALVKKFNTIYKDLC